MTSSNDLFLDKDETLRRMVATDSFGTYFGVTQKVFDQVWKPLHSPQGNSIIYISMEIGADLDVFNPVADKLRELGVSDGADPAVSPFVHKYLFGPQKIPNYGGGLGILAGDTLKSVASCKLPVLAISLLYKKGYFTQLVDSRLGQISCSQEWHPAETPGLYLLRHPRNPELPLTIEVPFFDEADCVVSGYARLWLQLEINESLDHFVPKILLDYSLPESPSWIREASNHLYDASSEKMKATQRRMLGAGIAPVMDVLGLTAKVFHLNEQHGVVVILHVIAEILLNRLGLDYQSRATDQDILAAADEAAQRIVYTIHTPVKAGHDRFEKSIYAGLSHSFCQRILALLARDDEHPSMFNFTAMAMRVNRATNSVSRLHKLVTRKQFPQFADKISAITNGVHHLTWISPAKAAVFDAFPELKGWRQDPSIFAEARTLAANKRFATYFLQAWTEDTGKLIDFINRMLAEHRIQAQMTWIDPPNFLSHLSDDAPLSPEVFTLGFARRFSTYKRADLIFDDIDTLAGIVTELGHPVNFVYAGKAHPADEPGKHLIRLVLASQQELYEKTGGLAKLVFIPGYDMAIAKLMVAGVHAWLNCPKRPLEASGTSGMKAAMNGVPNVSIMDGWWIEGYHEGQTGWKFGHEDPIDQANLSEDPNTLRYAEDAKSFYELFPKILKSFYEPKERSNYLDKCIMNLILNIPIFNTHRMVAEYAENYNLPLPAAIANRMKKFRSLYRSNAE